MTSTQNNADAGVARIENRYDPLHRRVLKSVFAWNAGTSTWTLQRTHRFVYDAWNVIEEIEVITTTRTTRYTWGRDLSGGQQGAGGVGGLLMAEEVPTTGTPTPHYYWYDGNVKTEPRRLSETRKRLIVKESAMRFERQTMKCRGEVNARSKMVMKSHGRVVQRKWITPLRLHTRRKSKLILEKPLKTLSATATNCAKKTKRWLRAKFWRGRGRPGEKLFS
jgi:hypothetical protein